MEEAKDFFWILTVFLKPTFNFQNCLKKDECHSLCISEVIDGEKRGYVNI